MSAENKMKRPWDSYCYETGSMAPMSISIAYWGWLADRVDGQAEEIESLKEALETMGGMFDELNKETGYAQYVANQRLASLEHGAVGAQQSGKSGQVLYADHLKKMEALQAQHYETLTAQQQAVADLVLNPQQPEPPRNPRQLPYAERLERMVCAHVQNPALWVQDEPVYDFVRDAAEYLKQIDAHLAEQEGSK